MSETQGWVFEPGEQSCHDLESLAEEARGHYFPEEPSLEVRWGRKIGRKRRRSIRLGSYDPSTAIITIHPLLDSPRVPAWFIQSIIFHEYLHHILGPRHDRRFQRIERRFRYHREAALWLHRFLPMLLGSRPRPLRELKPRRPVAKRPARPPEQTALF